MFPPTVVNSFSTTSIIPVPKDLVLRTGKLYFTHQTEQMSFQALDSVESQVAFATPFHIDYNGNVFYIVLVYCDQSQAQ